eukprot:CAMPEP_0171040136 /NCGR_PEP_ID=MMETSP0736-20130129/44477_1 /TAXON_ID=186038 /ORGANISM="Fragilariopsis kerguelensis, Strain L26-C5" /LENGTH=96 /DNA_ID=CAMNT_0011487363 /DNA_START=377 /DNA_END=664 /DNA_ORIENTATION=-
MTKQKGSVKQGAPYAPKTVFIAPKRDAVEAAPHALNSTVGVEWTKKTPTAMLVRALLKPYSPMVNSSSGAPLMAPTTVPMVLPPRAWTASMGEYEP